MTVSCKPLRGETAPALFRILDESALARGALAACAAPIAVVEAATGKAAQVIQVNAAFTHFFGLSEAEAKGRSMAALLLRGDEALAGRMLGEPRGWTIAAWAKDGTTRHVEVSAAVMRGADAAPARWVITFQDRSEAERLRAELESVKAVLAAASLGVRLQPLDQPAGGAEQSRVEVAPADELYSHGQPVPVLQQR